MPQQAKLPRQLLAALVDIAIDAVAVGVQASAQFLRQKCERSIRGCADADKPHEIIQIRRCAVVKLEREVLPRQLKVAENFRRAAVEKSAGEFHLPEPFLGVQKSLGKKKVNFVGGGNMGNGKRIPAHMDTLIKAGKSEGAAVFGERWLVEMSKVRTKERRKDG